MPSVVGSTCRKICVNMRQRQILLTSVHVLLFFLGILPDHISHHSLWLVESGWTMSLGFSRSFLCMCLGEEGQGEWNWSESRKYSLLRIKVGARLLGLLKGLYSLIQRPMWMTGSRYESWLAGNSDFGSNRNGKKWLLDWRVVSQAFS